MQCFMKNENTILRNVENVETTDERCCQTQFVTPGYLDVSGQQHGCWNNSGERCG